MVAGMRSSWPRRARLAAQALVAALAVCPVAPSHAQEDIVGEPPGDGSRVRSLIELVDSCLADYESRPIDERAAEEKILGRLLLQVDAVDRVCRLGEAQRQRCMAAARLEAKASLADLARIRAFCSGRFVLVDAGGPWDEFEQVMNAAEEVKQRIARPAVGDTLLDRVLGEVLDDTQRALWREETVRREGLHWRVVAEGAAAALAEGFGLAPRQYDAMLELLLERPCRINVRRAEAAAGDSFVVSLGGIVMARADRDRFRDLLAPEQWERLEPFLVQNDAVVKELLAQGVIDE